MHSVEAANSEVKDKSFYRIFFPLYFALVLQNVITLSVNLADNIMLGVYSEASLSGVAAVNQIQFIYQQLVMALGDGIVMFCSQYWGKKDFKPMKRIMAIGMQSALIIAVILFLLVSLFPSGAVSCFTTDESIIAEGVSYLNIVRFTYLFFALTQILLASLRSMEVVKIAFYLSILAFFVNCGINYILIFGHFGAPEMGVAGAAIGTLCARILEFAVLMVYLLTKFRKRFSLSFRDYLIFDKTLAGDYFKTTTPMLLVSGLWGLNTALQTVILGHMTSAAIAANSAASNLYMMVKSSAVGSSSAAAVMIGKAIGTGDIPAVKKLSIRLQRMFVLLGILSGILLFFLRIPVLRLYQLSPEAMDMAHTFLIILSVVCVGMSYQMPTNGGIIRGGGNAAFVVKMDLISIWCIVLPFSFFMAFVVKASPVVVVCCLNADQIFKCVPAFLESHYGNWIRKLTR